MYMAINFAGERRRRRKFSPPLLIYIVANIKLLSLQLQADLPGLGIIIEAGKLNDFLLQDQVYSGFSNA